MGHNRGLVVWNFDECGAPIPGAGGVTYFQHGLSGLVEWRRAEAFRALAKDGDHRDVLPVVVVCGSHSSRMSLLRTATGHARLFNLGRPLLGDDLLLETANNALERIALGTGREVPNTAREVGPFALSMELNCSSTTPLQGCTVTRHVPGAIQGSHLGNHACSEWPLRWMQVLEQLIPWLGWNPRTLVWMLQTMAARHDTASPRSSPLNVGETPSAGCLLGGRQQTDGVGELGV
jgi:hypothetical protein